MWSVAFDAASLLMPMKMLFPRQAGLPKHLKDHLPLVLCFNLTPYFQTAEDALAGLTTTSWLSGGT